MPLCVIPCCECLLARELATDLDPEHARFRRGPHQRPAFSAGWSTSPASRRVTLVVSLRYDRRCARAAMVAGALNAGSLSDGQFLISKSSTSVVFTIS